MTLRDSISFSSLTGKKLFSAIGPFCRFHGTFKTRSALSRIFHLFHSLSIVRTRKLKKGLVFEFNAPAIRKDEFSIL